ncbi:hypothetical protein [Stappia sp.]|uniref:hypothetical protein n=1 Tax=Stappia sp. TaxID=1870903 RepID=UPI003A99ADDE
MKQPASPARQAPGEGGAHRAADTALADDTPSSASPARAPDDAAPVAGQGRAVEAPRAAEDLGLGDRYRYLAGASGTRYLFSLVPTDALEDFRNAVVLIELGPRRRRGKPDGSGTGGQDQPRTVWIGELDRYGTRRGPPLSAAELRGREALVHLLAGRSAERRQVLEDLVAAFEDGATRVLFG